jgi:hypothetical protein
MNESFVRDVCRVLGPRVRDYNGMTPIRTPRELNEIRTAQGRAAVYLKTEAPKETRKESINRRWDLLTKGGCHV